MSTPGPRVEDDPFLLLVDNVAATFEVLHGREGEWLTPEEIAKDVGCSAFSVRNALKDLVAVTGSRRGVIVEHGRRYAYLRRHFTLVIENHTEDWLLLQDDAGRYYRATLVEDPRT